MKNKISEIIVKAKKIFKLIELLNLPEQVKAINSIKKALHDVGPFKNEPVDCVQWELAEKVEANDYNPNTVAPPEMKLLELSIISDGYTQPIVTWHDGKSIEVIDGFHRKRVGTECKDVKNRIHGYLPIVIIINDRSGRSDRIAATIRHNRARGKHQVQAMSDIVVELKKRNWSKKRIGKELGMDEDEVLRLCQISGLADVFSNHEFSQAWESEIYENDEIDIESEFEEFTSDSTRIYHTWEKWECYKAGFYENNPPEGMTHEQAELQYKIMLEDIDLFEEVLAKLIVEWKFSCEHYLTNEKMNRIAWLGQAALTYQYKIPSRYRGGYNLLSEGNKIRADQTALKYLNLWLEENGHIGLKSMEDAQSKTVANLY